MNKLTKVGCSALCGSLAAISAANAGDLSVTGSAHLTYVSLGGTGAAADPEADSIQASYTMGGATFSIAEVDVENAAYATAASADTSATIIYLGLAF